MRNVGRSFCGISGKMPTTGAARNGQATRYQVMPTVTGYRVTVYQTTPTVTRYQVTRYQAMPTVTGSGTRVTPKASQTRSRTARARASMSAPVAPPRFVRASTCLVDRDARGGSPASGRWKPLEHPA